MQAKLSIEKGCPQDIEALLLVHRQEMLKHSPEENVHALDSQAVQDNQLQFFALRVTGQLAGCGALKRLSGNSAELKSMRTAEHYLRCGVAKKILSFILDHAREQGIERIYLETGSAAAFNPAIALYRQFEFELCGPFANYEIDTHSVFYTKMLR